MINGFQKTSLIDYPKHICAVVFIGGCNFRCPFCHNPSIVNKETGDISEETILGVLEKRKKLIDGVCITGGEPLARKEVEQFIIKVRKLGLKVKLDTNGSNPGFLKELIKKGLIDYVAMDVKTTPEKYGRATGVKTDVAKIRESIRAIIRSGVEHEFRTTMVPGIVDNDDVKEIVKLISGGKKFAIQQFVPRNTLDEEFTKIKPYTKDYLMDILKSVEGEIKTELRA